MPAVMIDAMPHIQIPPRRSHSRRYESLSCAFAVLWRPSGGGVVDVGVLLDVVALCK